MEVQTRSETKEPRKVVSKGDHGVVLFTPKITRTHSPTSPWGLALPWVDHAQATHRQGGWLPQDPRSDVALRTQVAQLGTGQIPSMGPLDSPVGRLGPLRGSGPSDIRRA